MTNKEIKESHITLLDNGQLALTKTRENGKIQVLRIITREEVVNMAVALYSLYKHDYPEKEFMSIPFGEEKFFTLAMINRTSEK